MLQSTSTAAADCLGWSGKKRLSPHGTRARSWRSREGVSEEAPAFELLQAETSSVTADLSDQTEQIPRSDPAEGSKLL